MAERPTLERPFSIQFLLIDGFSMMSLSSAIEPLRAANRLLGQQRYEWALVGKGAGQFSASNGIALQVPLAIADAPPCDLTVVLASLSIEDYDDAAVFAWLRSLKRRGRMLGAISGGALILARAGVVRDSRVTIHWEQAPLLARDFPDLRVTSDLYCRDNGILTAAGGTAALDMMLALIAEKDGSPLAMDVADQFLHGQIRPSSQFQRQPARTRFGVTDDRLLSVIARMEGAIAHPARIADLAEGADISQRQLERLFQSQLQMLPSQFYMDLRLNAARQMILASTDVLETVAEQCGFSSLGHFSRAFKARFGMAPSHLRRHRPHRHDGFMQAPVEPM